MKGSGFFWKDGMKRYEKCLLRMVEGERCGKAVDLGCGDGEFTLRMASRMGADEVSGVEGDAASASKAESRGVKTAVHDLDQKLPFADGSFDLVLSNFTIEHVQDADNFVSEAKRVLKVNGVAVVGTENLAGTHNILALLLGYQPFPMSIALSSGFRIGNPLQGRHLQPIREGEGRHTGVFAFRALGDIFRVHGFRVEKVCGAGYPPFPGCLGGLLAGMDPRHAAFNIVKARKPAGGSTAG